MEKNGYSLGAYKPQSLSDEVFENDCTLGLDRISEKSEHFILLGDLNLTCWIKCGSRGGGGDRGSGPPLENQFIWVSIGNKQMDPLPLEKVGPPPPPGKCWTPSGTLKNDRFL